jgi:hypothetical protein
MVGQEGINRAKLRNPKTNRWINGCMSSIFHVVTRVLALELSCVHGDIALEKSIALFSATMLFHIFGVTRG